MRLLTRKPIYRAFAELDAYSDDRCRRFVKAAKRPWLFRLPTALAMLGCFALVAWGAVVVAAAWRWGHWPATVGPQLLIYRNSEQDLVTGMVAGGVLGFIIRDLLLRWRLRHVLRTRGICQECGYSLVSVVVRENGEATCTECGYTSLVDASLGELVTDAAGRVRYEPRPESMHNGPRWWTPARRAHARTWSRRVALGCLSIVVLGVIAFPAFIYIQARQAHAMRLGPAGVRAGRLALLPAGTPPDAPNTWDALPDVHKRFLEFQKNGVAELPAGGNGLVAAWSFQYLYAQREYPGMTNAQRAQYLSIRESSVRALRKLEHTDIHDRIREMVNRPVSMYPQIWDIALPPVTGRVVGVDQTFLSLSALEVARVHVAMEDNNPGVAVDALDLALGLARMLQVEPDPYMNQYGWITESELWSFLLGRVDEKCPPDMLNQLDRAARAWHPGVALEQSIRGRELLELDTTTWVFESPERFRFGRWSIPSWKLPAGAPYPGSLPLGNLWSNIRDAKQRTTDLLSAASAPNSATRLRSLLITPSSTALSFMSQMSSPLNGGSAILTPLYRNALITTIAIEQFRLQNGTYPQTLADLGADVVAGLPPDTFSGRPLGYRLPRDGDIYVGPRFALYSVGGDGVDNGGKFDGYSNVAYYWNYVSPKGNDLLMNQPPAP